MDIKEELDKYKDIVDKELYDFINSLYSKQIFQEEIIDSMKYSLFTGGKRLRPILLLKSCELISGSYKEAIPFALAMEMIHTYSLVHDDLPAMDDDDYRRGKKTNHKVYGEAIAILAGDGLLNLAYELVIDYIIENARSIKDFKNYISALNEIAKASGIDGMIGGQVIDIESDSRDIDLNVLYSMYENKTAALIRSSIVAGGIIGNASKEEIKNLEKYGLAIGLGYQIKDDILDIEEDKKANKTTYLSFFDKERAEDEVARLSSEAVKYLEEIKNKDISFLRSFAKYLVERKK